jgi:hypothetical protein
MKVLGVDHKSSCQPCSNDGHAALSTAAMACREPDKPFLTRRDRF